ncbi:peptide deformylase [secondary endosymbiont of Heteropsylla cubana]|uniref:Peptide deformylase n=1 Tax=secondary endosymbiont of Heteropsylla cubana TaxID=134287 RepID=J3VUD7_9ENTR|nr:peptide deformylase [secondary endosymbiont of Heteropsylla cubana]AFP85751.1 peptide deformylase [secondary endosymbiont of Heteropsylla cubana]
MALLKILYYPDKRLRKIAKPVIKVNKAICRIVDDMFETMYSKNGIGLAATQVDIHQLIIVIDISKKQDQRLVLINPTILEYSGKISTKEGCLSIPYQYSSVSRSEKVKVKALDYYGNNFYLEANDLLAICIQHEMDHLIGKLFIDYISPLKRQRIHYKMEKLARMKLREKNNLIK